MPTVLTEAEERDFLQALGVAAKESAIGARDQALFTLLLRSGMRLTAAFALDVEHLHLAEGTAVSQGKHARIQTVYFPKNAVKLLRRHLAGPPRFTSGPVFRSSRGRLSARQAQYRFRAALGLAGNTRPVTVRSLRHTSATRPGARTGDLRGGYKPRLGIDRSERRRCMTALVPSQLKAQSQLKHNEPRSDDRLELRSKDPPRSGGETGLGLGGGVARRRSA